MCECLCGCVCLFFFRKNDEGMLERETEKNHLNLVSDLTNQVKLKCQWHMEFKCVTQGYLGILIWPDNAVGTPVLTIFGPGCLVAAK